MRDEKHHIMWRILRFLAILLLVINFSRIYFLALLVGLLVLKYKHKIKFWLRESITTGVLLVIIFLGISVVSSSGQTWGWELLGVRLQSYSNPHIEISSNTRMILLPKILDKIEQRPIWGEGLGVSIIYTDSLTYQKIKTTALDWGYLELWLELGIFGLLFLLFLYIYAIFLLAKKIRMIPDWYDFDVGLLATLISLLIINITSPALFHVFGILYLVFALSIASGHTNIFEYIIILLYKIFNSIKSEVHYR